MHSPTLLILLMVLLGIMAFSQLAAWYLGRRVPALICWAGASLAALLSALSFLIRPYLPETAVILTIQISQFLIAYLMLMGARCYMGFKPWPLRYAVAMICAIVGVSLWLTLFQPDPELRVVFSSLVTGSLFWLCAATMAKGGVRQFPARYLFALPCLIHALVVLARIGIVFQPGDQSGEILNISALQPWLILEAIIALVMIAFATLMLVNETVINELRQLAEVDDLTRIFNRRSFLNLLNRAAAAADRMQTPLSVLLIDLDHFKRINDNHGHPVGDAVLGHFVGIVAACLRKQDVLGRIGGEEFAVFLPNAGEADARMIAERLRSQVAANPLPEALGPIPLTVSIGLAQYAAGEATDEILRRADAAMYRAKEGGRNRIEVWQANWAA